MFEARGVWDWGSYNKAHDRINRRQLAAFREYQAQRRRPGALADLIASDRRFKEDSTAAYAESWALAYYFCETQPRRYSRYLARTAARPPFQDYPAAERTADFKEIFGENMKMVEVQFLRYMKTVR